MGGAKAAAVCLFCAYYFTPKRDKSPSLVKQNDWLNRTTIYHLHRPIACSLQSPGSWELLEFDHACRAASLAVEERKVHVSPEPGYVFLFLSFAPFTLSTVCFAFW